MKQITIRVNTDQQVEQIRDVLADFDFVVDMGLTPFGPPTAKLITIRSKSSKATSAR